MSIDKFFLGYEKSRPLFEAVCCAIENIGGTEIRESNSQIAFWRQKSVALVWVPARCLRGNPTPFVLTLAFHHRDRSPRWKEIEEPAPGRFIHHLELSSVADLDDEVHDWPRTAWLNAA